jgi:hypothetical protein
LYGSIAVGSVIPNLNVPPTLPGLISGTGVSAQPLDFWPLSPPESEPVFSCWEQAVSTSVAAVRPAATRSHAALFLIKLVPP